jgi:hypothetical protein
MSLPGISPVKDATVTIDVRANGAAGAVVTFAGVLSHRDPTPLLKPFFERLHAVAVEQQRREVAVDLRELRFMNSASFKSFIAWVKANDALPAGQRYKIRFVLNPAHHWQEVSMHALSCFSIDAITVEQAR